jgi:hypothetical protein
VEICNFLIFVLMFIKQFVSHAMNFNLESSVFRESTNFFFGW